MSVGRSVSLDLLFLFEMNIRCVMAEYVLVSDSEDCC